MFSSLKEIMPEIEQSIDHPYAGARKRIVTKLGGKAALFYWLLQ
jgi:hypothetical protein